MFPRLWSAVRCLTHSVRTQLLRVHNQAASAPRISGSFVRARFGSLVFDSGTVSDCTSLRMVGGQNGEE